MWITGLWWALDHVVVLLFGPSSHMQNSMERLFCLKKCLTQYYWGYTSTQIKEPLQFVSIMIWVTIAPALVKDPILPCLQHLQRAYWWSSDTHTQNRWSFLKFKIFVLLRCAPDWQCAQWSNNFGTGRPRFETTLTTPIGRVPGLLNRFWFQPFLMNVRSKKCRTLRWPYMWYHNRIWRSHFFWSVKSSTGDGDWAKPKNPGFHV